MGVKRWHEGEPRGGGDQALHRVERARRGHQDLAQMPRLVQLQRGDPRNTEEAGPHRDGDGLADPGALPLARRQYETLEAAAVAPRPEVDVRVRDEAADAGIDGGGD